jgi:hypothetical protein
MNSYDKYIKYKNKYIKYKNKYINLKNNTSLKIMNGGSNIFDLDKKYSYKKGELQKNLKDFEKKFGKEFKIKYENIIINVNLVKGILPNGISFYRMYYDIPKRTTKFKPFLIDFIDIVKGKKNNNTYISNIQKTDNLSGTQIVKICLKINEILGAKKTLLGDGTKVICEKTKEEMDLSFIKLLERDKTFYMNLGFDFEITNSQFPYYRFSDKNKLKKEIDRILKYIRSIKTSDIIYLYQNTIKLLNKVIKDNKNNKINFEILKYNSNPTLEDYIYIENPNDKINEIITESNEVLDILIPFKNEYLYKVLINLFKNDCEKYSILIKYIVDNMIVKIIYGKEIIYRDYINEFNNLLNYRFIYDYSYTF